MGDLNGPPFFTMESFEHYLVKLIINCKKELTRFNNLTVIDLENNKDREKIYREYIEARTAHNTASRILSRYRKEKNESSHL